MAMNSPRSWPEQRFAADLLPPLCLSLGVVAAFAFGALMLVEYRASPWPYALVAALVLLVLVGGGLMRRGKLTAAAVAVAYGLGTLPILSVASFGFESNPLIYLAAIGVLAGGLLVGPAAPLRIAGWSLLLLAGALALPGLVGQPRPPVAAALALAVTMTLLLVGVAVLSWAAAHYIRSTIRSARATAVEAEAREAVLHQAQAALDRVVRERDQLSDRLVRQSAELEGVRASAETAYRAKSSFMATMSHELRTPLNIIIGFSSAMVDHPEIYEGETLPPGIKADLVEIRRSGQHLLGLINDILDLARVEAGRLELKKVALALTPILDEMLRTAQGLLKDRPVQLRREYQAPLFPVLADEMRVRQVLLNLVSNACKFTNEGEVTIGARADVYEVVIWVRDTGIGIGEADQLRIFDQFEQVDRADTREHTGTGLGLSICRWLVDLHGGRLWLESELGRGSTFYFTLPRAQVALATALGAREPILASSG